MAALMSTEPAEAPLQRMRRKPRAERRLAIITGADLTAACAMLAGLAAAGYRVSGLPVDPARLHAQLDADDGEAIMLNDYSAFHATLPAALRDAVTARWGAAERDAEFRPGQVDCGRFVVPALRFGAVAIVAADDPGVPPRHRMLARIAWIADSFHADAAVAWRPIDIGHVLPLFVPTADDIAADATALVAALDGDTTALQRWQAT